MLERKEWLRWRKNGIGASDAYILMGQGFKGSSVYGLYEDKIDKDKIDESTNYVVELGNKAEPAIRSYFELQSGKDYTPRLFEKGYFLASLDGWNEEAEEVLEIKLINNEDWLAAKNDKKVPDKYYTQIQHQLMVTDAKKAWFVIYDFSTYEEEKTIKNDGIVIVEVLPDKDFQRQLVDVEKNFWENHVLKKNPPKDDRPKEKTEADINQLSLGYDMEPLVSDYREIKSRIDHDKKLLKITEDEIKRICISTKADKVTFNKSTFTKVERVGSIDYAKVPELKDVDLEPYRKKSSTYWKFNIV